MIRLVQQLPRQRLLSSVKVFFGAFDGTFSRHHICQGSLNVCPFHHFGELFNVLGVFTPKAGDVAQKKVDAMFAVSSFCACHACAGHFEVISAAFCDHFIRDSFPARNKKFQRFQNTLPFFNACMKRHLRGKVEGMAL